jgi:hypothetical protein
MNIFYLDQDPKLCAQYHADKHVVKMILESAQLLCTAVNVLAGEQVTPYKSTHVNHPCSIWVRESYSNWLYVFNLMMYLEQEWNYRYKDPDNYTLHKSVSELSKIDIVSLADGFLPYTPFTLPALCMPDYCKTSNDPVECYREYYRKEKVALHKWTGRDRPHWL